MYANESKIKSALKEIKKAYVLYLRFWVALKVCCSTSRTGEESEPMYSEKKELRLSYNVLLEQNS